MKWYVPWISLFSQVVFYLGVLPTEQGLKTHIFWYVCVCVCVHTVCPKQNIKKQHQQQVADIFFDNRLNLSKIPRRWWLRLCHLWDMYKFWWRMFFLFFQTPSPSWTLKKQSDPELFGMFSFRHWHWALFQPTAKHHQKVSHCSIVGCRRAFRQVTSDTSLGLMFAFSSPKSSRCSCDRSFLRCMLPLNQRDLLTESFPLIHVQHGGFGASAWTVSGTEISRPFATPSRGVFLHQPRNPS